MLTLVCTSGPQCSGRPSDWDPGVLALTSSQTVGHRKWQSWDLNPSLCEVVCDGGRGQGRFQEEERSLKRTMPGEREGHWRLRQYPPWLLHGISPHRKAVMARAG